jgi:hypothetical protein
MERIERNFPHGTGMDDNLDNMRALLQVLKPFNELEQFR